MDKSEIENKKREYLTKNIIEKGYNPEELSKYIIRTKGTTSIALNYEQYVEIIEKFKNEQFKDIYNKTNSGEQNVDRQSGNYIYRDFKKEFKCRTPAITPMLALEQKKTKIKIEVTNPEKVEGGFFSKSYYTYIISCHVFQSKEKRTSDDIEWLRNRLSEHYYLNYIPPLTPINYYKDSENELENSVKNVQNFFDCLSRKKIFRTAGLLYYFLTLGPEDFENYKEKLSETYVAPFASYITCKGTIKSEINIDKVKFCNNLYSNLELAFPLYEKITKIINNITENFDSLERNFHELSSIFNEFEDLNHKLKTREVTKKLNDHFYQIFQLMSNSYKTQKNLFNHEIREYFTRNYYDLKTFENLNNKYKDIKYNYERFNDRLAEKKENLFLNRQVDKMDFEPNFEIDDIQNWDENKNLIFDNMLYKENKELENLRIKIGFVLNYFSNEYFKVCKYHSERAYQFGQFLNSEKKKFVGDSANLIEMFTVQL